MGYIMNNKEKFDLGTQLGFNLAKIGSKATGKIYIHGLRVHHYILLGLIPFTQNPLLKGFFYGAGIEDLNDLLTDLKKLF